MEFFFLVAQLTILPALLSASVALIVAIVPRWRRATPSTGVSLILFSLLGLHALQVIWAVIQTVGMHFDLEGFEPMGPYYYYQSMVMAVVNLPTFLFWLSRLRRRLHVQPTTTRPR